MKRLLSIASFVLTVACTQGELLTFKLSPPGASPAVGLSPGNEVPAVSNSTGSGDVILSGITFDTNTLTLNLAIGYGSSLGFTDLTAPASMVQIHGPADATGTNAVLFDLTSLHLPAGDPTKGGLIFGSVVYTATETSDLLAGLNYVNILTTNNPDGEIRGQLILVTNSAPTLECPLPVAQECTSPAGALINLSASVSDPDGDALTVVWTINGVAQQTDNLPASAPGAIQQVPFIANFEIGTHQVEISVSDGVNPAVTCSTTVTVQDTTPPSIQKITANPGSLWPPNHKMISVKVSVATTSVCGPVTSKITSVTSNEPQNGLGDGDTDNDWVITGDLTLKLRAERSGKGSGRVYTIAIEAADAVGNKSTGEVTVTVPKSKGWGRR